MLYQLFLVRYLYWNINFKTQTKVSLISSIGSGFVGISMALAGMGSVEFGWSTVISAIIKYFIFMDVL